MKTILNNIFCGFFVLIITTTLVGQKWENTEYKNGDTTIQTAILIRANLEEIDSTETYKIIYKYLNFYLLEWRRYNLKNQAVEDEQGVHHKEKFWKYFKFYNKNGKQLLTVQDKYHYEQGDATYCIYLYNEKGELIEVTYFRDEVVYDENNRFIVRHQKKAVDAYLGGVHKYVYQHERNGKQLKEYRFNKEERLTDVKILKLIKPKKK